MRKFIFWGKGKVFNAKINNTNVANDVELEGKTFI